MINIIWCAIILLSVLFSVLSGRSADALNALYSGIDSAVKLSITLLGVMAFWSGISRMCEKNGISQMLTKLLAPVLNFLFPDSCKDEETKEAISMNIISNMLGLGNAATPLGIKAAEKMSRGKAYVSDETILFVVLNTCSLQIIPTSISALRLNYGSEEPFSILPHIWIVSVCTVLCAVLFCKILSKAHRKKR